MGGVLGCVPHTSSSNSQSLFCLQTLIVKESSPSSLYYYAYSFIQWWPLDMAWEPTGGARSAATVPSIPLYTVQVPLPLCQAISFPAPPNYPQLIASRPTPFVSARLPMTAASVHGAPQPTSLPSLTRRAPRAGVTATPKALWSQSWTAFGSAHHLARIPSKLPHSTAALGGPGGGNCKPKGGHPSLAPSALASERAPRLLQALP